MSAEQDKTAAADRLIADFGKFRVVSRRPAVQYGDSIFVQELVDAIWKDRGSYNEMSDDYAYSNAKEDAQKRAKRDASPEVVKSPEDTPETPAVRLR